MRCRPPGGLLGRAGADRHRGRSTPRRRPRRCRTRPTRRAPRRPPPRSPARAPRRSSAAPDEPLRRVLQQLGANPRPRPRRRAPAVALGPRRQPDDAAPCSSALPTRLVSACWSWLRSARTTPARPRDLDVRPSRRRRGEPAPRRRRSTSATRHVLDVRPAAGPRRPGRGAGGPRPGVAAGRPRPRPTGSPRRARRPGEAGVRRARARSAAAPAACAARGWRARRTPVRAPASPRPGPSRPLSVRPSRAISSSAGRDRQPQARVVGGELRGAAPHRLHRAQGRAGDGVRPEEGEQHQQWDADQELVADPAQPLQPVLPRVADDQHERPAVAGERRREQPGRLVQPGRAARGRT